MPIMNQSLIMMTGVNLFSWPFKENPERRVHISAVSKHRVKVKVATESYNNFQHIIKYKWPSQCFPLLHNLRNKLKNALFMKSRLSSDHVLSRTP